MALLTQRMSRCCPLLKKCNIVTSTEQLRKQSIKIWTSSLKQPGLLTSIHFRRSCQPLSKNSRSLLFDNLIQFCSSSTELNRSPENNSLSLVNKPETEIKSSSDNEALYEDRDGALSLALEEISEDEALQIIAEPPLPLESFTLQDYIDHSETLRKLVLLGVDLSKVEKRPSAAQLLLRLDFEKDVKKVLLFLKDVGVEDKKLGAFITKNPYILREDLENLETRVAYLTSKKFSKEEIARMVSGAPYLLLFNVERLDNRLGFFQKELGLNVQKTRDLVTRLPKLLTGSLEPIKENLKVYELELGFSQNEIRHIVHRVPKALSVHKRKLTETFDYLHNVMGIPHSIIVHFPQVFNSKQLRIKERHMFLKFLGRAQYDPKQPSYISLEKLVSLPDDIFCTEVAKATVQDFHKFQKTL
ncbi:transcription termination factor 3, mitochondrial isoform X2 [Hemicordylus capensis]|nr:transcription termination factor 3, mitochondrial isoform X2 [Hemicordylus capensis]XP_053099460.1 transcription termination factor 3, mitochondrial isoform X2 [Hemicordylus capensis]XP_053099461.1 transcription termination factor 3, mitochondrial isoform X2 [Hemicordylus capensis]